MTIRILFAPIWLSIAFGLSVSASAQDRDMCLARTGKPSIEACSRVIAGGELAGKDLATIYVVRATMFRSAGSYDQAIEDMTRAIPLLQSSASSDVVASAYATRASFYALAGNMANALSDYRQALTLDPANSQAREEIARLEAQAAPPSQSLGTALPESAIAAPHEPLPTQFSVPTAALHLVETSPFFANAPVVRIGGYSEDQMSGSTVNGAHGTNFNHYDDSIRWLRQAVISDRSIMQSKSTFANSRIRSETISLGAADGMIGLGSRTLSTSIVPNMRPMNSTYTTILTSLDRLEGFIFPMRVGNRFSFETTFRIVATLQPDDLQKDDELCEVSQQFDAKIFHPDLTGVAFLVNCRVQDTYRINKIRDSISQSKTIFFEQLGIPIRVDPQNPPQKLIQTYFDNEATETARLQSFILAR